MTMHLPGGPQSPLLNKKEDYSDEAGARTLAGRIRAFWNTRGLFPNVWVDHVIVSPSFSAHLRDTWIVCSDMKGGRPV